MPPIQPNNPHTIHARHLLVSYFQMVMVKAGLRFDDDNRAEIEEIINEILTAVDYGIQAHVAIDHQDLVHKRYMETR